MGFQALVFYFVPMKYLLMAAGAGLFFATAPGNVCVIRFFIACFTKPVKNYDRLLEVKHDFFVEDDDPPDDWLSEDYHRIKKESR